VREIEGLRMGILTEMRVDQRMLERYGAELREEVFENIASELASDVILLDNVNEIAVIILLRDGKKVDGRPYPASYLLERYPDVL